MQDQEIPKLRLAVVGCGAVAKIHHLPAITLSERVEAAVLVDADAQRAKALADQFGVPEVATDYRDLPGRVDAAVVALPNDASEARHRACGCSSPAGCPCTCTASRSSACRASR